MSPRPRSPLAPWCLVLSVACGTDPSTKATSGSTEAMHSGTAPTDSADLDSAEPAAVPCAGRGTSVGDLTQAGCVSEAACAQVGEGAYEYYGYAAAGGADFDGDGVEDVVVGAVFADAVVDSATVYDVGRAEIWSGASLAAGGDGAPRSVYGLTENEQAGSSVVLLGDLDGDGDSELLVGARNYGPIGTPSTGAVHLVRGSTSGPLTPDRTWTGSQTYGRAGHTVASPGDLDGDGIVEVAVGGNLWAASGAEGTEVFDSGRVYVASGADLPASGFLSSFPVQYDGVGTLDQAGTAIAGGDLDGDGYADLVVGAPYGATSRGAVHVLRGSSGATETAAASLDVVSAMTLVGDGVGDAFGWSLAVGEVTGDDQLDIVVGAPLHDAPWGAEGAVHVFSGPSIEAYTEVARRTGEADDHQLGTGLIAGVDLDADGTGDLVAGAVSAWHELRPKSGRTYIVSGGAALTGTGPVERTRQVHAASTKDFLGRSAAASDIDADGTPDLIVSTAYANADGKTDAGGMWLFFGG